MSVPRRATHAADTVTARPSAVPRSMTRVPASSCPTRRCATTGSSSSATPSSTVIASARADCEATSPSKVSVYRRDRRCRSPARPRSGSARFGPSIATAYGRPSVDMTNVYRSRARATSRTAAEGFLPPSSAGGFAGPFVFTAGSDLFTAGRSAGPVGSIGRACPFTRWVLVFMRSPLDRSVVHTCSVGASGAGVRAVRPVPPAGPMYGASPAQGSTGRPPSGHERGGPAAATARPLGPAGAGPDRPTGRAS